MMILILIFSELLVLYFLSKKIQQRVFSFFWRITKRKNWAVYLTAVLFAPGTFFHEISHFLSALFLLVPVGDLKLLPEVREDEIKLGSVGIGKTDPVRRFLIGVAPFILGTLAILAVTHFALKNDLLKNVFVAFLLGCVVFEIGNTMFASKKDLEGALGLLIFLVVVYLLTILLGIDLNFSSLGDILTLGYVKDLLKTAALFLTFPLALDLIIITLMRFY